MLEQGLRFFQERKTIELSEEQFDAFVALQNKEEIIEGLDLGKFAYLHEQLLKLTGLTDDWFKEMRFHKHKGQFWLTLPEVWEEKKQCKYCSSDIMMLAPTDTIHHKKYICKECYKYNNWAKAPKNQWRNF